MSHHNYILTVQHYSMLAAATQITSRTMNSAALQCRLLALYPHDCTRHG